MVSDVNWSYTCYLYINGDNNMDAPVTHAQTNVWIYHKTKYVKYLGVYKLFCKAI